MNASLRKKLNERKRRNEKRLDRGNFGSACPVMSSQNIQYEVADRTRATAAGGIGVIHRMVKQLKLDQRINLDLQLFKMYAPYTEADHILNIAYNLLAGGTCLEHLELRRQDEAYLDALGAVRIPDPTTAGDFCRRFNPFGIFALMQVFNKARVEVWKRQPDSFFDEALIDADGTMVETYGECKQGIDINHKGQWGYHPLLISLANTREPLYIVNRSGNRPSHEGAAVYLDQAIDLCRRAGFRKITLRGDTDFTQSAKLDEWDEQGVEFIFGIDAMPNLYEIAESLPKSAWKRLNRPARYKVMTEPRQRPDNVKEEVIKEREFTNIRLEAEYMAEFEYRPLKCKKTYRIVVVWKDLAVTEGQKRLFDDTRCFFYITNDRSRPPIEIVFRANDRCDQENLIQQNKSDVRALTAPLDNLESNWAYMVIASLAWSLKAWAALLLPTKGRWHSKYLAEQLELLRMDFTTFRNVMINIPAQVVNTGRRVVCRLLAWNRWQPVFFRLLDALNVPQRC